MDDKISIKTPVPVLSNFEMRKEFSRKRELKRAAQKARTAQKSSKPVAATAVSTNDAAPSIINPYGLVGKKFDTRKLNKKIKLRDHNNHRKTIRHTFASRSGFEVQSQSQLLIDAVLDCDDGYVPHVEIPKRRVVLHYAAKQNTGLETSVEIFHSKQELFGETEVALLTGLFDGCCSHEPYFETTVLDEMSFLFGVGCEKADESGCSVMIAANEAAVLSITNIDLPRQLVDRFLIDFLCFNPITRDVLSAYNYPVLPGWRHCLTFGRFEDFSNIAGSQVLLPYIGTSFVLNFIPSVEGGANFCDTCNKFVAVCGHLLFDVFRSLRPDMLNLASLVEFLYDHLWDRECFSGSKPCFSLMNPYTRLCFSTAYSRHVGSDIVENWRLLEHKECEAVYGIRFEPQALINLNFLERFKTIINRLSYFFPVGGFVGKGFFLKAFDIIKSVRQFFKNGIIVSISKFSTWVIQAMCGDLEETIKTICNGITSIIQPLMVLLGFLAKMLVRYCLRYTVQQQLVEAIMDTAVYGLIGGIPRLLNLIMPQAENDVAGYGYLFSILVVTIAQITGAFVPQVELCNKLFDKTCRSVANFDRAGVWKKLTSLSTLVKGNETPAFMETLRDGPGDPAVVLYEMHIMVNERILTEKTQITDREMHALACAKHDYDSCLRYLDRSQVTQLIPLMKPALAFCQAHAALTYPRYRACPDVFMFFGEPGIGKSDLVEYISSAIHYHQHGRDTEVSTSTYHINPTDQYSSGYVCQDVFVFDEFLQDKDGPTIATQCPSVSMLFKLCTTAPSMLNMASLEDKGKFLECKLVLGATNIDLSNNNEMRNVVKSIASPAALFARLTYRVRPILKPGFIIENRKIHRRRDNGHHELPIEHISPEDLYFFQVYDSHGQQLTRRELVPDCDDDPSELFEAVGITYSELLLFIFASYTRTASFVPPAPYDELTELLKKKGALRSAQKDLFGNPYSPTHSDSPVVSEADDLIRSVIKEKASLSGSFESGPSSVSSSVLDGKQEDIEPQMFMGWVSYWARPKALRDGEGDQEESREVVVYEDKKGLPSLYQRLVKAAEVFLTSSSHYRPCWARMTLNDLRQAIASGQLRNIFRRRLGEQAWLPLSADGVVVDVYPGDFVISRGDQRELDYTNYEVVERRYTNSLRPDWKPLYFGLGFVACVGLAFATRYAVSKLGYGNKEEAPLELLEEEAAAACAPYVRIPEYKVAEAHTKPLRDKEIDHERSGPQSCPWESVDNSRGSEMCKTISRQVVCLVNTSGIQVGNAFFLDETNLLVPTHVLNIIKTLNCVYVSEAGLVRRTFHPDTYRVRTLEDEVSIVVFNERVKGIRNLAAKFAQRVTSQVSCVRVTRDPEGQLFLTQVVGSIPSSGIEYACGNGTMRMGPSVLRIGEGDSYAGLSGSLYLRLGKIEMETIDGGLIIGFHIAGQIVAQKWIMRTLTRSDIKPVLATAPLPIVPDSDGPLAQLGIIAKKTHRIPLIRKATLGRLVHMPYNGEYTPALLFPSKLGENVVDPTTKFKAQLQNCKSRVDLPTDLHNYTDLLIADKIPLIEEFDEKERTFENCFAGSQDFGSIDRSASPGYPFCLESPTKGGFCLTDVDTQFFEVPDITPNESFLKHLLFKESQILTGDEPPPRAVASLKEETRVKDKVVKGNTRIYSNFPMDENILQKKHFMKSYKLVSKGYRVGSGQFDLDSYLYDAFNHGRSRIKGPNRNYGHIDADHINYDLHCSDDILYEAGRVLRSIELGRLIPYADQRRSVNAADDIRLALITRFINFIMHFDRELIAPPGNPSGHFLTSIVNFIVGELLLKRAIYKMFNDRSKDFKYFSLINGDDSDVILSWIRSTSPNIEAFNQSIRDCGFEMTNSDKTGPPRIDPIFDDETEVMSKYTFCSRHITKTGGVLAIDRLLRILPFVTAGKQYEIMPQRLLAVAGFALKYAEAGLLHLLGDLEEQVKFCGFNSVAHLIGLPPDEVTSIFQAKYKSDPKIFEVQIPEYNKRLFTTLDHLVYDSAVPQGNEGSGEGDTTFEQEVNVDSKPAFPAVSFIEQHISKDDLALPNRLDRPFKVDYFATGTTFAMKTYLAPGAFFEGNFYAQMGIFNVSMMRCTTVMRVIASGSPFVYGRVLCGFCPYRNLPSTVQQAYGYPCIELDLSASNQVELRFPCCVPHNWLMVNSVTSFTTFDRLFEYGRFFILPMTSISESVNISVFMWLEDVKTRGPSVGQFTIAQVYDQEPYRQTIARGDRAEEAWLREHTPDWVATGEACVASIARSVERLGYAVTGPIKEGGAALFAGWCAPPMDTHLVPTTRLELNTAQVFCERNTVVLGCSQLTRLVQPPDLFNTTKDEMDIYHMCKDWQYLASLTWSAVTAPGGLMHLQVRPDYYHTTSGAYPHTAHPTRLCYISTLFNLWRGGLKFKLSIPKTNFQTGVLEIVYQAGNATVDVTTSKATAALPRILWDITTSNTIEFECPYCAPTAWIPVMQSAFAAAGVVTKNENTSGGINVNIINPLADTSGLLPDPVDILIYIAAMPDIEFAMPMVNPNVSYPDWANTVGADAPVGLGEWEPQGHGDLYANEKMVLSKPFVETHPSNIYAHLSTTGERWLNLRPLTRRWSPPSANASMNGTRTFADLVTNNLTFQAIGLLFAFYCGSFRVLYNIDFANDVYVTITLGLQSITNPNAPVHLIPNPLYGNNVTSTSITVPYQHLCSFLPVNRYGSEFPDVNYVREARTSAAVARRLYSAGDDFTFGWLVGAPSLIIASTVNYATKTFF